MYFFSNLSARESSFLIRPPPSWNRCTVACSCHLGVILGLEALRRCNHLHQSDVKLQTQGFWLAVSGVAVSYADNSDSSFIYRRIPAKTFKAQTALRSVHFSRSRSVKSEAWGGGGVFTGFMLHFRPTFKRPPPCLFHVENSHLTFIFSSLQTRKQRFSYATNTFDTRHSQNYEAFFFFKRLAC